MTRTSINTPGEHVPAIPLKVLAQLLGELQGRFFDNEPLPELEEPIVS